MMIYDARALEAAENVSKAEFFKRHGFVLLQGSSSFGANISWVMETLFPHSNTTVMFDVTMNGTAIRGPGAHDYAFDYDGNHQDTCLNASGWKKHVGDTPQEWNPVTEGLVGHDLMPDLDFMMWVNLWGPYMMNTPLMNTPLAVMDPITADLSEIYPVPVDEAYGKDWLVQTRCSTKNKWYYYPHMYGDEFMVFTHFQHHRGDDFFRPYLRSNLHGPFDNPQGMDKEPRMSGERRVFLQGTNHDRSTNGPSMEGALPPSVRVRDDAVH